MGLGSEAVLDVIVAIVITIAIGTSFGYEEPTKWEMELADTNNYRKVIQLLQGIGIIFFGVAWFVFTTSHWSFLRPGDTAATVNISNSDYVYPFKVTQALFVVALILYKGVGWTKTLVDYPKAEDPNNGSAYYANFWLWLVPVHYLFLFGAVGGTLISISVYYQIKNSIAIYAVVSLALVALLNFIEFIMVCMQIAPAYRNEKTVKGYAEVHMGGGMSGNSSVHPKKNKFSN